MPGTVVVGYEGGGPGEDVLAFGRRWAERTGDRLVVVTVHPGQAMGIARGDAEWVAYERTEAKALLDEARRELDDVEAEFRLVDASSPAHGLHDVADGLTPETGMLVLGARRGHGLRRTFPGSTAQRMLQGAPVPVTLVPARYRPDPTAAPGRVSVAYVGTSDGRAALASAAAIAGRLGTGLDVLSVVPDTWVGGSIGSGREFGSAQRRDYERSLDDAVAGLPPGLDAAGRLLDGPVVDALVEITPEQTDLLVVGSRGYGPLASVLLGGVSSRVVRNARVPVTVVPRGRR
ncbi:universal stress protein [Angustibacter aerolatus]